MLLGSLKSIIIIIIATFPWVGGTQIHLSSRDLFARIRFFLGRNTSVIKITVKWGHVVMVMREKNPWQESNKIVRTSNMHTRNLDTYTGTNHIKGINIIWRTGNGGFWCQPRTSSRSRLSLALEKAARHTVTLLNVFFASGEIEMKPGTATMTPFKNRFFEKMKICTSTAYPFHRGWYRKTPGRFSVSRWNKGNVFALIWICITLMMKVIESVLGDIVSHVKLRLAFDFGGCLFRATAQD